MYGEGVIEWAQLMQSSVSCPSFHTDDGGGLGGFT